MKKIFLTLIITIILTLGTSSVFAYKIDSVQNYDGSFYNQILYNYLKRNQIYNDSTNIYFDESLSGILAGDYMYPKNNIDSFAYKLDENSYISGSFTRYPSPNPTTRIQFNDVLYTPYDIYTNNTGTEIKYYSGSLTKPSLYLHSNENGAINIYLPQANGIINEDYILNLYIYIDSTLINIKNSYDLSDYIVADRSIIMIGDDIDILFNENTSVTNNFSIRISITDINSENEVFYASSPIFNITEYTSGGGGGETPPSGGSSNITGTGTGTSTGTVDENGNVNIDNNIDIDLDTTPITDNIDKNTQELIDKLEEEPTTTEDDFKNNFVDTEIDDPSDDFFTWIFENLENIFLSTEEQTLDFSLYTENTYEISTNQIYVPDGILKTLVGLSCDFGICYWILKDVRKTINKVKEGSIESLADEDITANMV